MKNKPYKCCGYKGKALKEFEKNVKFGQDLEKSGSFLYLKDWYVLIAKQKIQGVYPSDKFGECIEFGYKKFGLYPIVVHQMYHVVCIPSTWIVPTEPNLKWPKSFYPTIGSEAK